MIQRPLVAGGILLLPGSFLKMVASSCRRRSQSQRPARKGRKTRKGRPRPRTTGAHWKRRSAAVRRGQATTTLLQGLLLTTCFQCQTVEFQILPQLAYAKG